MEGTFGNTPKVPAYSLRIQECGQGEQGFGMVLPTFKVYTLNFRGDIDDIVFLASLRESDLFGMVSCDMFEGFW